MSLASCAGPCLGLHCVLGVVSICEAMRDLALAHAGELLEVVAGSGLKGVTIVPYSLGCGNGYCMASMLHAAQLRVQLVLLDGHVHFAHAPPQEPHDPYAGNPMIDLLKHGTGVKLVDDEEALRQQLGWTAETMRQALEMIKMYLREDDCHAAVAYNRLPPSLQGVGEVAVLYVESKTPCYSGARFANRRRMSCGHNEMCTDERAVAEAADMVRSLCEGA